MQIWVASVTRARHSKWSPVRAMHIHLDPVGGIAGDMFVAALLDCFPDLAEVVASVPTVLGIENKLRVTSTEHNNGILTGRQFFAEDISPQSESHPHTSFRKIRADIENSALPSSVATRAVAIFELLAQSEAQVHGTSVEEVSFHEVGALDSIADIVTAACLIDALGPCQWSIAPIPMGAGRVMTQHGILPVPAPATANLLKGFVVFQDGIQGERVTPTGAAIIRHLSPKTDGTLEKLVFEAAGTGFGTKQFEQIPNILRVMAFKAVQNVLSDKVTVFEFEIDDQTPEDLAIGLEHIRDTQGVLDVTICPVLAKKGRQAQRIQILGAVGADDLILNACFEQTTTIGVRYHQCERAILKRSSNMAEGIAVKIVQRPSGPSAKAESDDLEQRYDTADARARAGQLATARALSKSHD